MAASERFDVVVVGAGAMGSATAWHLAREGRSVALLEQFEPGHVRGSSHGEVRIFRVAYRDARYTELASQALPLWQLLQDESGEVLLEQNGQLDHGYAEAIDEIEANLARAGRPYERVATGDARARWPGMRFDESVIFSPEGGRAYASRTVNALLARARRHGALVRHGVRVENVSVQGEDRACVHTPDGSYDARAVVVAAGAWAAKLLGDTVRLPALTVTCEQPAHFAPRGPSEARAWPAFLHHVAPADGERGHTLPLGFGAYGLFAPGTGMKVGEHGTGVVVDPDDGPFSVEPERLERLRRYVESWFPGLDATPVECTPCLYTSTSDDHFVLDRAGPIVVCSPCSGHGFKFVPAIGRITADLALGRPGHALDVWRLPGCAS